MPVLNRNDEQSVKRLDGFLRESEFANFFQSFAWAREKSDKWSTEFVYLEKDGEITCAALVLIRKLMPGFNMMYCPRGPVADVTDVNQVEALLAEMAPIIKKYHPFVVKFDPAVAYDESLCDAYREHGFRVKSEFADFLEPMQQTKNMVLGIEGLNEEQVMAKFAARTRYDVRLAFRKGVTVRQGDSEDDLQKFYELMLLTGERQGIPVRSKEYFQNLLENFGQDARLYMAEYEGKCLASSLAINYGKRVTYYYGASSTENRDARPAYALQLAMIRWALETGCRYYDLGAVLNTTSDNGLYLFKIGFCKQEGVTRYIGEIDRIYSSSKYFIYKKGIPFAKRVVMKILPRG